MARADSRRFEIILAVGVFLATPLIAESVTCPGGAVIIKDAGDRAEALCKATAEVTEQLASCNLTVTQPVTIEIVENLPRNCYGLYHCEDQLIQLPPLQNYASYLSSKPDSPFGHLDPETFLTSVLRHELAHAALGATPCPYEVCPVTREFVAYTMQSWFLSGADRLPFEQHVLSLERPMTQEDVSALALMMVPNAFIRNAYAYLSQQKDPCAFISAIAMGNVVLDLPYR